MKYGMGQSLRRREDQRFLTGTGRYVDDLIDGFLRLMASEEVIGPVNIGNPGEFTIAELAELVTRQLGSRSPIKNLPASEDDPQQRKPDIRLANAKLGWSPKVPLEQGLELTTAYFREQVGASQTGDTARQFAPATA